MTAKRGCNAFLTIAQQNVVSYDSVMLIEAHKKQGNFRRNVYSHLTETLLYRTNGIQCFKVLFVLMPENFKNDIELYAFMASFFVYRIYNISRLMAVRFGSYVSEHRDKDTVNNQAD